MTERIKVNGFHPNYIEAAIVGERQRVADASPGGRNQTLFTAAALGSLPIPGNDIVRELTTAAMQCGLVKDDGRHSVVSTINSGLRAGRQSARRAPDGSRSNGGAYVKPSPPLAPIIVEPKLAAVVQLAGPLPACDAPDKFVSGDSDGPPKRVDELRRHVYRRDGVAVRVKIKVDPGQTSYVNSYAVAKDNGVSGWQAKKPEGYVAVPYVGEVNSFDSELAGDDILWPEGEKDVDTLGRLNLPAFAFGGTGDGLPDEAAAYLASRRVVILSDNDDGGRAHADKKAALAHAAGAASVRVVHFPELPPKKDVTDFIEAGGTIEQLIERIEATPQCMPPAGEGAGRVEPQCGLVIRCAADIEPEPINWLCRSRRLSPISTTRFRTEV